MIERVRQCAVERCGTIGVVLWCLWCVREERQSKVKSDVMLRYLSQNFVTYFPLLPSFFRLLQSASYKSLQYIRKFGSKRSIVRSIVLALHLKGFLQYWKSTGSGVGADRGVNG